MSCGDSVGWKLWLDRRFSGERSGNIRIGSIYICLVVPVTIGHWIDCCYD